MKIFRKIRAFAAPPRNSFLLLGQMRDYATIGLRLSGQRLMIFGAALGLEAFYYSPRLALLTLFMVAFSEIYDYGAFRMILGLSGRDPARVRQGLMRLHIGTVLSAGTISFFALSISVLQGPTPHFMPLFFLFAASLFAAMNNHQLVSLLLLRLLIYGVTFLFIPVRDIVLTSAPITSELWVQFFTSIFVLYFIIDCSRIYLIFYRRNLRQMKEVKREHDRTKAAYRTKSEFLATVSHELRTPLTSIKGSLDLANSGALGVVPERLKRVLDIAQRNAGRLSLLINDLLDLQSMEAGRMRFSFAPVRLRTFLPPAVAANRPFAERLEIEIVSDTVSDDLVVWADPERLEQVMSNLLSNAAKFSYAGGIVRVSVEEDTECIRLVVSDEGVGLAESDHEKVFDEFSQLDSSDQRKVGGTGLGMNISKRIVQAHGGKIGYFRNTGPGTTFFVELKRFEPAAEHADNDLAGV